VARQTLKDFLASIGATESRISYVLDDLDGDGMMSEGDDLGSDPAVPNADDARLLDLQNIQTGLLGDYLRFVVDLVRPEQAFKVNPGNVEAASSNRGDVLSPAEDQGVDEPFVRQGTTLGSTLSKYSNSGQFDNTDVPLSDLVDKTGNGQATVDAHQLLSNVQGNPMDQTGRTLPAGNRDMSDVEKAAEGSLQFRNRFAPRRGAETSGFANNPTPVSLLEDGTLGLGTTTSQREFGAYNKEADSVVMDDLKQVGLSLMLKAAGWDDSLSPGDSKTGLPRNASSNNNDLNNDSPISPRLIDPAVLRAQNALGAPSIDVGDQKGVSARDGRGDLLTHDDITASAKSHGSTYTPESQFDSDVIRAQAIAAVVALLEASRTLFDQISASIAEEQALYPGPYIPGQGPSVGLNEKFNLLKKLVITPTDYPYDKCVLRGLQIFFTDNKSPTSSEGLGSDKRAVSKSQHIAEAPSYWLAIARSVLRGAKDMGQISLAIKGPPPIFPQSPERNSALVQNVVKKLEENKLISLLNVAATVGDVSFRMAGGSDDFSLVDDQVGPWNVDRLPDSPSTRISKSRSGDGNTALSLAWRGNSVPALYMVPKNVIKASIEMGTVGAGTNPLKGMMGSSLVEKTYLDSTMEGTNARIPSDIVQRMEDTLDAEYVPFYFHDIRTNEIVTFHAFLGNLRDAYSPNYSGDVTGYGRMDAVKMYAGTRRRINLSFYAVSTSKQDFDEMWFKINKLVTLVYPKWTQGDMVKVGETSKFIQPFSQVLGASPIIRLRVGDVVKSNYSKFNLARMFGIGDTGVSPKTPSALSELMGNSKISNAIDKTVSFFDAATEKAISANLNTYFYTLFGSPLALSFDPLLGGTQRSQIARSALSTFLRNEFVNPLAIGTILNRMMDPDSVRNTSDFSSTIPGAVQAVADTISSNATDNNSAYGYRKFETHFLRPTMGNGYMLEDDTAKKIKVVRPLKIMILGQSRSAKKKSKNSSLGGKRSSRLDLPVNKSGDNRTFRGPKRSSMNSFRTLYRVKIVDLNASNQMLGKTILVTHADIMPNPNFLFNTTVLPTLGVGVVAEALLDTVVNTAAKATGIPADQISPNLSNVDRFMDEDNNPIVKSFNSSRGRGLAGAITSLEFDWMEFPWEIDWNSRAPMACKITMAFDVIHDLPPGIDHSGFNRGPVYNVGSVMEYVAGDVADDNGEGSKSKYNDGNRTASTFSSIDSERGD